MTPEERKELLVQSRKDDAIWKDLMKTLKCRSEDVPAKVKALIEEREALLKK